MSILDDFFDEVVKRKSVFRDKYYLSIDYVPEELPHRENEMLKIANILAPILRRAKPSNIFEYGPVGTGKTAVTKLVLKKLLEKTTELGIAVGLSYVNCRFYRTNYRALIKIAEDVGLRIPKTGLPPDVVFSSMVKRLDNNYEFFVVVFDEIDWLVKFSGDDILYQFTRLNSELSKSNLTLIGITNDVKFREYLDARVLSSLSEETVVFQPYNQEQLYDILLQRAKLAFNKGAIEDDAIRYAAAIAARDGDARRAIDMLRIAGEIADRRGDQVVTIEHVKMASEEVEKNIVEEIISILPPNQQLLLLVIAYLTKVNMRITTGLVKKVFDYVISKVGRQTVSLRRLNDYLAELETLGLISSTIVSFGRYGRSRVIKLEVPLDTLEEFVNSDPIYRELYLELLKRKL